RCLSDWSSDVCSSDLGCLRYVGWQVAAKGTRAMRSELPMLVLEKIVMRILVVEDEPDLLNSIAQALREEGYAVDTAANGEDGLFNAESTDYDPVVLDVMMPKMDGWEMLARLRKKKKTPVLMLTARDQS